jgi:hypothetical protein
MRFYFTRTYFKRYMIQEPSDRIEDNIEEETIRDIKTIDQRFWTHLLLAKFVKGKFWLNILT